MALAGSSPEARLGAGVRRLTGVRPEEVDSGLDPGDGDAYTDREGGTGIEPDFPPGIRSRESRSWLL